MVTRYNTSFVYCRELAPGTVSLTGDWARDDDSKQNSYYRTRLQKKTKLSIRATQAVFFCFFLSQLDLSCKQTHVTCDMSLLCEIRYDG